MPKLRRTHVVTQPGKIMPITKKVRAEAGIDSPARMFTADNPISALVTPFIQRCLDKVDLIEARAKKTTKKGD